MASYLLLANCYIIPAYDCNKHIVFKVTSEIEFIIPLYPRCRDISLPSRDLTDEHVLPVNPEGHWHRQFWFTYPPFSHWGGLLHPTNKWITYNLYNNVSINQTKYNVWQIETRKNKMSMGHNAHLSFLGRAVLHHHMFIFMTIFKPILWP